MQTKRPTGTKFLILLCLLGTLLGTTGGSVAALISPLWDPTALHLQNTIVTIDDGDTTPSVLYTFVLKTANTGATMITDFNDGFTGQPVFLIVGDGDTTFDFTGTRLKGNGGSDYAAAEDDLWLFVGDGTDWYGSFLGAAAGAGDMTKAVYDGDDDGYVDGNDTAYAASWNGNANAPTMDRVYDQIETLGGDMTKAVYDGADDGSVDGNDTAYAATWDGNVNAASMNRVFDKIEALASTDLTDTADILYETELDSESELEGQIADMANIIQATEIDSFSEIDALVSDKTLVNEEDPATWDALGTFALGVTITTGDPLTLGANRIDNGSDLIDGEMIAADTIDDDSIDFADVNQADFEAADGTNILLETEIDASAELLAIMEDETGTGALVFATSPTLVTPALGTIASGVGTALTALNGENIQDDTIDDDAIDWADCNFADFDYQTAWRVFYSDTAGDVTELALGAGGEYLKSNGAAAAPTWAVPAGSGDMTKAVYDVADDGFADGNDTAYAASWNGNINAPTMDRVYDQIETLGGDMTKSVYDVAGDGYVDGNDTAYAATWDGNANAPSMNRVYDKIEALASTDLTDTADLLYETELDSESELEAQISDMANIIQATEIDSFSEIDALVSDKTLVNKEDGAVWGGVHDFGGATTFEVPNAESGDATLSVLGQIHIRGDEDRISYHVGVGGEVAGEVTVSVLGQINFSIDPGLWYDSDAEVHLFPVLAKKFPNGIIIDYWECSCNVDPDVEINADLRYADAWLGYANAADIDEIDTTNGTSSEDTDANINGGAAVAAGKVIYIGFDADPEGTCTQFTFTMLFHAEED